MDRVIFAADLIAYAFFWSFPFRCKIYGWIVFKRIMQGHLLRFALDNLLVFAPLFNTPIGLIWQDR